jgi:hypothetical protein
MSNSGSSSAIKLLYPGMDNQSFNNDISPRRLTLTPDSKIVSDNPNVNEQDPMSLTLRVINQPDRRKLIMAEHKFCTSGIKTAA